MSEQARSIKPCPFCGNEAYPSQQSGRYGRFGYIECDVCGARTKAFGPLIEPEEFDTEQEFWSQAYFQRAVRNWNRRISESDV